jgi:membrane associated rhomboid family serine protease
MGMGNRPYWQDNGGSGGGSARIGLPKPGLAVGGLLIVNLGMFVLQHLIPPLTLALAVIPVFWWEAWRYVTFQFLHAGVWHLLFNMLGLYFLGMYLERAWGTIRFLAFYLVCGVIAGLTHVTLGYLMGQGNLGIPLVGASGGVYAVIAACAILFPSIQIILVFFPVPIRVATLLFFVIAFLSLLSGEGGGISNAAHFGGMVAGGLWVWLGPKFREARAQTRQRLNEGAWERKMRREADDQAEVDRILEKIRREGLGSLTGREKRTLQQATERQREKDRQLTRM